ncbi:hypothetical protein MHU86_20246 [Fragilaria crotonensis]|nr:hypothetical protein MHU86_20246 [Fragilaria crotonensis]
MQLIDSRILVAVGMLLLISDPISAAAVAGAPSLVSKHVDAEQITAQYEMERRLPGFFENLDLGGWFDALVSTPIEDWEASQWMFAAVLLLLVVWCCGCIGCARRRQARPYGYPGYGGYGGYGGAAGPYGGGGYGPGGYGQQQPMSGRSSGACGCLRNLLLCFCCYELCCADCKDVPCFHHSSWSGNAGHDVYRLQPGVEMV